MPQACVAALVVTEEYHHAGNTALLLSYTSIYVGHHAVFLPRISPERREGTSKVACLRITLFFGVERAEHTQISLLFSSLLTFLV